MFGKKIREKWVNWLKEYDIKRTICGHWPVSHISFSGSSQNNSINQNQSLLPISTRINPFTLASGGWIKSKKQQLKESRINKIRKVQGENPNVILPNDEYIEGLVSVKPMSVHINTIFYFDFKYNTIKDIRRKKLNKIKNKIRINKIKYIEGILQKII